MRQRKTAKKTWQVYCFGKRNVLKLDLNESRDVFFHTGRGRLFHVERPKVEKANSGMSGMRNIEAESIRNRGESMGGCVR